MRLLKNPKRHALTPEAKERQLAALRPNMIKPGEVRNPGGRPKRKPFHEAAMKLAEEPMTKKTLRIGMTDTVASAVAKSLAVTAVGFGPQKVTAAKELADRAEGSPTQVVLNEGGEGAQLQRGVTELLVRFGIQLGVTAGDAER